MDDIKKMVKDTYRFSKKLTKENQEIFTDIACYLRASSMREEDIEESLQEILDMFLRAQAKGINIHEVIGEDYKAFCNSVIEASGKNTFFKSLVEKFNLFIIVSGILIGINFIVDNFFKIIKEHKVILDYSMTLGGTVNIFLIFSVAYLVFKYIGKNSFESTKRKKYKLSSFLFGVFYVVLLIVLVFIEWLLADYILFTTKIYYLGIALALLYYFTNILKRQSS